MREILFRGKRKVNDEWVHGFLFVSRKGECKIKWYDPEYGSAKTSEVYPETVGQFTGLTDKNGKKIFEGDVLKEPDIVQSGEVQIKGQVFEVAMRKGVWCVLQKDDWDFLNSYVQLCEVIGNIHDNPDLLEVTDNA